MLNIHPSALIDPQVKLADDVYIGPGCVMRGAITIGAGCKLHGNVYLEGPLTMGTNNRVYPFACLGFAPQDHKFDPATPGAGVAIGDGNVFREGFTLHRATGKEPTRIGNRGFYMVNSHVAHDCITGDGVTLVNGALLAGHVRIGDNAVIGGNSVVHQFVRIGRMAMMGGGIGVMQEIPPFCVVRNDRVVASLNIIGLRRSGLRQHIVPLKKAFEIIFKSGHSNTRAAERIEIELAGDPLCAEMAAFIRSTKRGICQYDTSQVDADADSAADTPDTPDTPNTGAPTGNKSD
ncbi:MAG: acyl-ACP--UDP-N-acetylglucosamine O-acyltransferase [Phycisphaeraceae bacterium]